MRKDGDLDANDLERVRYLAYEMHNFKHEQQKNREIRTWLVKESQIKIRKDELTEVEALRNYAKTFLE